MSVNRDHTFVDGEVLFASQLNGEFDNILDNGQSVGFPRTTSAAFAGNNLTLDADADTILRANTDDTVEFMLSSTALFTIDMTATTPVNGVTVVAAAADSHPDISATGSDTNIDLDLNPKGSGVISIQGEMFASNEGNALAMEVWGR